MLTVSNTRRKDHGMNTHSQGVVRAFQYLMLDLELAHAGQSEQYVRDAHISDNVEVRLTDYGPDARFQLLSTAPDRESIWRIFSLMIGLPLNQILQHFEDMSNSVKRDEAWWVPDVCAAPAGIWRGFGRENQEESLCYCGVPNGAFSREYDGPGKDFPANTVLMVFLDRSLVVTKWRKCREDPAQHGFPVGHDTRFGERLWPRSD